MTTGSLRLRLFLSSLLAIALALLVAGFLLVGLFDRHVTRRVDSELASYLRQLTGVVEFQEDGTFYLGRKLSDTRFDEPFSGLYWQIEDDESGQILASRSLWDSRLPGDRDVLENGAVHHHDLKGPNGSDLRVQERLVTYELPTGSRELRLSIAIDDGEIAAARRDFAAELSPSLVVLGLVLLAALWLQISIGLKPLEAVRRGVQTIRSGRASRLTNTFPSEVTPLVDEVNDLLKAQEENLAKARARATDLAHGLKTPLTVLQTDAERLRERGQEDIAQELEGLALNMTRHIDQELARTRIRSADTVAAPASPLAMTIERIVQTLKRTPRGEFKDWQITVPGEIKLAIDEHDLTEMLGNVLDNASKWAEERITVTARTAEDMAEVVISDDGPGVPDAALGTLAQRGVRLDEQMPGSGIGLAIVQDIVTANRGDVTFSNNPKGGFSVTLLLPLSADE